jgi:hypothetical protein
VSSLLRFSFLFLEAFSKRLSDDGFSAEKAVIAIGCTEIAAVIATMNILVLLGLSWMKFSQGVAVALALVVFAANYNLIRKRDELDAYRKIYARIPASRRAAYGAAVLVVSIAIIVAAIVTAGMVAKLNA